MKLILRYTLWPISKHHWPFHNPCIHQFKRWSRLQRILTNFQTPLLLNKIELYFSSTLGSGANLLSEGSWQPKSMSVMTEHYLRTLLPLLDPPAQSNILLPFLYHPTSNINLMLVQSYFAFGTSQQLFSLNHFFLTFQAELLALHLELFFLQDLRG